jgi:hypothetical protein
VVGIAGLRGHHGAHEQQRQGAEHTSGHPEEGLKGFACRGNRWINPRPARWAESAQDAAPLTARIAVVLGPPPARVICAAHTLGNLHGHISRLPARLPPTVPQRQVHRWPGDAPGRDEAVNGAKMCMGEDMDPRGQGEKGIEGRARDCRALRVSFLTTKVCTEFPPQRCSGVSWWTLLSEVQRSRESRNGRAGETSAVLERGELNLPTPT